MIRVRYPGPGGPTQGLWMMYDEDVAELLDELCAEHGRISVVTSVGQATEERSYFDRWLDGRTAWSISVGISEGGPVTEAWTRHPGHMLTGVRPGRDRNVARTIHVDVGTPLVDDLDLSTYVDQGVPRRPERPWQLPSVD